MDKRQTSLLILIVVFLTAITLSAQTPTITNVSYYPNPFSPDDNGVRDEITISFYLSSSGPVTLQIGQGAPLSDLFSTVLDGNPGLNLFVWDGRDNSDNVLPDGKYGLKISFTNTAGILVEYLVERGIIIDTTPPEIDIISSGPNPFSPNGDGYQDVHVVQYRVINSNVFYIGLIEVDLASGNANFVADVNGNPAGPSPIPYSDGMYLILNRPSQYFGDVTAPSTVEYSITIGGTQSFDQAITRGRDLYKLGQNYNPYYSVSASIGLTVDPEHQMGTDYLAVYGIEGNATFNIFNNDGSILSLNDLYPIHYGSFIDNPADLSAIDTTIGRGYTINVGATDGSIPGSGMADGRYIYRIMVTNAVEHATVESGELLVNSFPIELAATVDPNRISPQNQDGLFDQAVIQYQVTEDAYITVKIWDLEDNLIRTLRNEHLILADTGGYVLWDGRDGAGNFVSTGAEETFIIEVSAQDRHIPDDVTSIQQQIIVDNEPPAGANLFQPQPSQTPLSGVTISGISDEMNSSIILFQNGVNRGVVGQTGTYPGYFEFNVTLEEGENTIYIKMRDSVANLGLASNTVSMLLDSQPPQVIVTAPAANAVFTESTIDVSANITDSGVGVETVRFGFSLNSNPSLTWLTGTLITGNSYGASYSLPQSVDDVQIDMFVEAADSLGNTYITPVPRTFYYQQPATVPPPQFIASYPADNQNINLLANSTVEVTVQIPGGLRTDPDYSYIILYHQPSGYGIAHDLGATISYSPSGDNHVISLSLTNPLETNGGDDGEYRIFYRIEDLYGNHVTGEIFFNYDTLDPFISSYRINIDQLLFNMDGTNFFNEPLSSIQITVDDLLSGINFASNLTRVFLYDGEDNLIQGIRLISGNTIRWFLNNQINPIPNDPQEFQISAKVTDLAGNQIVSSLPFTLIHTQEPDIVSLYPAVNSNINNLNGDRVTIRVADQNGFGLNNQLTSITLIGGGVTHSPGQNATLEISNAGPDLYDVSLVLTIPLPNDGSADENYSVTATIVDNIGEQIDITPYSFTYDTQAPVKDYALASDTGGVTINLIDQMTINQEIDYVEIGFTDVLTINSGVNFSSPQTKVAVYMANGTIVQGTRQVTGNAIRWQLVQPLSADGTYYVDYMAADYAGNIGSGRINFVIADPNAPGFASSIPSANEYINTLDNNQLRVDVEDIIGIDTMDFTLNYLHLESPAGVLYTHNNGATLDISETQPDIFSFTLTLDYPLPSDGSEDGVYKMIFRAENSDGYSFSNNIYFTYDTLSPTLQNAAIGTVGNLTTISSGQYFYGQVSTVRVQLADITSALDWQTLELRLTMGGVELDGQISIYPNQNRAFLILDEALSTIGQYTIETIIEDTAGNILEKEIHFNLNTFAGNIISISPPNGSFINNSLNHASITVGLLGDDSVYEAGTSIHVVHPHGDTISVSTGATMTITQSGSQYTIRLDFDQPLINDGTDEGQFTVNTMIETTQGALIPYTHHFVFDSRPPYATNLRINQTETLYAFETVRALRSRDDLNYYYPNTINSIRIDYKDQRDFSGTVVSGVDFAPNVSKIYLTDGAGNMIDGTRSWNQNETVIWTLNQPLTTQGTYTIVMQSGDQANNYMNQTLSFELIETEEPQIVTNYPIVNSNINNLNEDRVTIRVADQNGFGLNNQLTSITLIGGGVTYSPGQNATLEISNAGPDLYDVSLVLTNPLPNDGSADDVYTVNGLIIDLIGEEADISYDFTYDTQVPAVSNRTIGNNDGWQQTLVDGITINQEIDYLSVDVSDNLSGINFNSLNTYLRLYRSNGTVVSGVMSNDGTTITWTLNNSIPNDGSQDGGYYVLYSAVDYAQNDNSGRIDFNVVNPFSPQLVSQHPSANAMINDLTPAVIEVNIFDDRGINTTDYTISYLTLLTPEDTTIEHNNGAVLSISETEPDNYQMMLTLNEPLPYPGQYRVNMRAENVNGYSYTGYWYFVYDNVPPSISEIKAGLANNTEQTLAENTIVYNAISYIVATVYDTHTSLLYPNDETFILLTDSEGIVVSGTLSYTPNENRLKLVLDEPLTNTEETFTLTLGAVDIVENYQEISFDFHLNAMEAEIVEIYPAPDAYINSNLESVWISVSYGDDISLNQTGTILRLKHPDGTYIEDGNGATQEITESEGIYEIKLNLNEPLSTQGDDDGLYELDLVIATDLYQEGPFVTTFTYDRIKPFYEDVTVNPIPVRNRNVRAFNNQNAREIRQERDTSEILISHSIYSVQATFGDLTSPVNFASNMTRVYLTDESDNVLSGFRTVSHNTVTWTLHNPLEAIPENEGNYTLYLQATDMAGNVMNAEKTISMISNTVPILISYSPESLPAFTNSFSPPVFEAVFYSIYPLELNTTSTYIRLIHPNGDITYHNQGAILEYDVVDRINILTFTLFDGLSDLGEDDGFYNFQLRAENSIGMVFETTIGMFYDTRVPTYTDLTVIGHESETLIRTEGQTVYDGIASLSVKYNDLLAGVNYVPNLTNLSVFDAEGQVIPGVLSYEHDSAKIIVVWTIQPEYTVPNDGSQDGQYTVRMKITDKAGNQVIHSKPIHLLSIIPPENLSVVCDAVYKVHLTWCDANQNNSQYGERSFSHYRVYRMHNAGHWSFLGQTEANLFVDNLLNHPDGAYTYRVRTAYTNPQTGQIMLSPEIVSNTIILERFYDVTFNLTLSDNQTPSGINLHLISNDGLYNQEFVFVTGNDGVVNIPDVFAEEYILTLSKPGYSALVDTVMVNNENTVFDYELIDQNSLLSNQADKNALFRNFPNPFNPVTEIRFSVKEDAFVELNIYNIKGQTVTKLINNAEYSKGFHSAIWNGNNSANEPVPSGIYFYRLQIKSNDETYTKQKKMMLLK